jgi:hypothetical protein
MQRFCNRRVQGARGRVRAWRRSCRAAAPLRFHVERRQARTRWTGLVGAAGADGGAAEAVGDGAPAGAAGERFDQDEVGAEGVEGAQAGVQALRVGGGVGRQGAPAQAGVARIGRGVGEDGDAAALARKRDGLVDA